MGAGLAGRPSCLPHSQVLMGAGLAGRPPCLPHSHVLMGDGLAGRARTVKLKPTNNEQKKENLPKVPADSLLSPYPKEYIYIHCWLVGPTAAVAYIYTSIYLVGAYQRLVLIRALRNGGLTLYNCRWCGVKYRPASIQRSTAMISHRV